MHVVEQFRVGMEIAPPSLDLGLEVGNAVHDRHQDGSSRGTHEPRRACITQPAEYRPTKAPWTGQFGSPPCCQGRSLNLFVVMPRAGGASSNHRASY